MDSSDIFAWTNHGDSEDENKTLSHFLISLPYDWLTNWKEEKRNSTTIAPNLW